MRDLINLIFAVVLLIVVIWLVTTASKFQKKALNRSSEAIEMQRRIVQLTEEMVALQKETNRFLQMLTSAQNK